MSSTPTKGHEFAQRLFTIMSNCAQQLGRKLNKTEWLACVSEEYNKTNKERKPRVDASQMSDEEWVRSLEQEPALKGVNVRQEISRCQFWCKNNKRLATRRTIINWLNKADRVADLKAMGAQHATGLKPPPPAPPEGWEAWLTDNMPDDDHRAYGTLSAALNCHQFTMMPSSFQARCRAELLAQGFTSQVQQIELETKLRDA